MLSFPMFWNERVGKRKERGPCNWQTAKYLLVYVEKDPRGAATAGLIRNR